MRIALNFHISLILGVILMVTSVSGHDLTPYRWKNRILLIFSPDKTDSGYEAFNKSLEKEILELRSRDLIVFRIFETSPSFIEDKTLSFKDAKALRNRFRVSSGRFTVILMGKDGGVKMVRQDQAELQEFLDLIDTMPMRQQEMREKGQNG
ncbi:MAG: DUF4174 domain-containing protein [Desulfobacterales bacterium]